MLNAALTLPAEPRSAGLARRFVTDTLDTWDADGFAWGAMTVVSELATNAVLHARTEFTVSLRLDDDVLRVEVADSSPQLPAARDYGTQSTTGRGLAVMGSLSQAHGCDTADHGKTVWCEMAPTVPGQRGADPRDDAVLAGWSELVEGADWSDGAEGADGANGESVVVLADRLWHDGQRPSAQASWSYSAQRHAA